MKRETIALTANQAQAFIADCNIYPCKITVSDDIKKRSLPANSVQHVFYKIIADYTGEDIKTVGSRMKRDIGLSIALDGDNAEKTQWILNKFDFWAKPDQVQLALMDWIPVTSKFTSKQHTIFRDNMIELWRGRNLILEYK
jgi:hypothetical protein